LITRKQGRPGPPLLLPGLKSMVMKDYYSDGLCAEKLKRCYEIASPRVQQYLKAEVDHVLEKINPGDMLLELGCGYGRVMKAVAERAGFVVGIDTSLSSLLLARQTLSDLPKWALGKMDAVDLAFRDRVFDLVICIQNGISAFHVDQKRLVRESLRVVRKGGAVLFSSYSDTFWDSRLEWFEEQARAGLLGEIDYLQSRDGRIICKDGFTASTVGPAGFLSLVTGLKTDTKIVEVDGSSLFCEITPH
jgi:ubiquinone/menaquinone biosynthesis C-methylase UbiE